MKYKNFNFALIFLIPFVFSFYFSLVYFFYRDTTSDSFAIETYFNFKESAANAIHANKILFTSGSSNFLGIRAYQIEDTYNVPTVNMSINAGLRAEYILDRLKKSINPGDVVIVPFEYSNFTYTREPSITLNKYLLTYDKEYFLDHYDFVEQLKILSSISILDFFKNLIDVYYNDNTGAKRLKFLKNINKNGDMLNMVKHDSLKTKAPPFKLPDPIRKETIGLKAVKEFNDHCRQNNISFFITFPNIVYDKIYTQRKYQDYFDYLFSYFDEYKIEVIGSPLKAMYPRKMFFDSEYHLTSEGSDKRTQDFIRMLNNNKGMLTKINAMKAQPLFSNQGKKD